MRRKPDVVVGPKWNLILLLNKLLIIFIFIFRSERRLRISRGDWPSRSVRIARPCWIIFLVAIWLWPWRSLRSVLIVHWPLRGPAYNDIWIRSDWQFIFRELRSNDNRELKNWRFSSILRLRWSEVGAMSIGYRREVWCGQSLLFLLRGLDRSYKAGESWPWWERP